MSLVPADVAVIQANKVMDIVAQIKNLRAAVAEIVKVNATTPLGSLWNVLHTITVNSDGTLGTRDSGAPVPTNPIDTTLYTALARAVKSGDLANALQIVVDFSAFCDGTQVAANASRPGQINNVAM